MATTSIKINPEFVPEKRSAKIVSCPKEESSTSEGKPPRRRTVPTVEIPFEIDNL
jgi:hypothetical protein